MGKLTVDLSGITIKTVSVGYKRKMNLGDYNSADFECSMWADLDDGVDPLEACAKLGLLVKENVRNQAMPVLRFHSNALTELANSLPDLQKRALLALLADTNLETVVGLPLQLGGEQAVEEALGEIEPLEPLDYPGDHGELKDETVDYSGNHGEPIGETFDYQNDRVVR